MDCKTDGYTTTLREKVTQAKGRVHTYTDTYKDTEGKVTRTEIGQDTDRLSIEERSTGESDENGIRDWRYV